VALIINTPRISAKKLAFGLAAIAVLCAAGAVFEHNRITQIDAFNHAISTAKPPATDQARFATAYWLAKTERYKDAALILMQIAEHGDANQRAAVQYNIGNIFFLRGLAINGANLTVRNEAEYLLRQAKTAYINSIKLDNSHWDVRHNLDRVLGMLPATPTPGVTDSESPGLIMGNIPVGLP
jgi:mxaK protein